MASSDYNTGTRYQICLPWLTAKRLKDAHAMIKRLGDAAYDPASKTWAGTCEDDFDQSNLHWLATTYGATVTPVNAGDTRAELLRELAACNTRRAQLIAQLGQLDDAEQKQVQAQ